MCSAAGSVWQNPYPVSRHGLPACLALYEARLRESPELLAALPGLAGRELGCWCKPGPCHGDIIIKIFKETQTSNREKKSWNN